MSKRQGTLRMLISLIIVGLVLVTTTGCDSAGAGTGGGDGGGGTGGGGATVYAVGDTGPAGGLIFYIDEADEHSWTYLEVAPASTEWTGKEWGDYEVEIGGDAALTSIGDGQAATTAIVAHMVGKGITGTAAQLCDALSHNGLEDWFLPSKDELNAIWENIVDDGDGNNSGVGGFTTAAGDYYWSSSEYDSRYAWAQRFYGGAQGYPDKPLHSFPVRAVRAF